MQLSPNGSGLIEAFEQLRLIPYLDSARLWTVGWGHALTTPDGRQIKEGVFGTTLAKTLAMQAMLRIFGKQTITQADADAQFAKDIATTVAGVTKLVAADTTQAQFDAMVCLAFNIGLGGLHSSAVLRLHNAHEREVGSISMHDLNAKAQAKAAPTSMPIAFVRWDTSGGEYELGLFRRRLAELLVYSGWDFKKAYDTAESFKD